LELGPPVLRGVLEKKYPIGVINADGSNDGKGVFFEDTVLEIFKSKFGTSNIIEKSI